MRWEDMVCPECGAGIAGVVNEITADLQEADDGSYEFTGTTDFDTQTDLVDGEGREKLVCHNGHEFWSRPLADSDFVACHLCWHEVPVKTAHLHNGKWIGDACCWDERLRASE